MTTTRKTIAQKLHKLIKEGRYDFIAHCRCNECISALEALDKVLQTLTVEMVQGAMSQMSSANLSQLSQFAMLVQTHMHVINVRCNANLQFKLPSYLGVRGTTICKFTHGDNDYDITTFKNGQQIK